MLADLIEKHRRSRVGKVIHRVIHRGCRVVLFGTALLLLCKDYMDWDTEHLRLTFFLRAPIDRAAVDIYWNAFAGGPVQTTVESRVGLYPTLELIRPLEQEQGLFVLRAEGLRFDLIVQGEANNPFSPPSLGEYSKSRDILQEWIARIPEVFPHPHEVWRMAVGGAFLQKVSNQASGYQKVQEFVPDLKFDPEKASDLFYRINYPVTMNEGALRVNVLTEWTVAAFTTGLLSSANQLGQQFTLPPIITFYLRGVIDINTVDSTILSEDTDLQALAASLWERADGILEKGINHD